MRRSSILLFTLCLAVAAITKCHAQSCRTFVWHNQLLALRVPENLRGIVGKDRKLVLNEALSPTDQVVATANREDGDPHAELLVVRSGKAIVRYRLAELPVRGWDAEWGSSAFVVHVAHLCSGNNDIVYFVLQAGNSGGHVIAFTRQEDTYRLSDLGDASLGRLVLSVNDPRKAVLWSEDSENGSRCTGCPKHYFVTTLRFDGEAFRKESKKKTHEMHNSFQDDALLLQP